VAAAGTGIRCPLKDVRTGSIPAVLLRPCLASALLPPASEQPQRACISGRLRCTPECSVLHARHGHGEARAACIPTHCVDDTATGRHIVHDAVGH
jgi:hypothetical protein